MPIREFDVFISYSSFDVDDAEALQNALEAHGLKVWRDRTELRPGDHVDFAIPEGLKKSDAVVVLWTANSSGSAWVRHEASWAAVEGRLIPLAKAGFEYSTLNTTYRDLNAGDLQDICSDPSPLIEKLGEIRASTSPQPPARVEFWRLPTASNAFVGRADEIETLRLAWAGGAPNLVALVAAGGTGKTMLASAFLDELGEVAYAGAEAVYAFSFDSQGTDEKRLGSSDLFFTEALKFFGEDPEALDGGRARASRLAAILAQTRTLLILDGIEPMQSPLGGSENGRLRDDAMSGFLTEIARLNAGLCVVTTRLPLADLNGHGQDQVSQIRLPNLPLSAAVSMLRSFGLNYPQEQLEELAREFGQVLVEGEADPTTLCHAKAIALIGGFISENLVAEGNAPTLPEIRDAFAMPDEAFLGQADAALKKEPGYAVYKMVRRYEILFEERLKERNQSVDALASDIAGRQLALLRIMGLFDRPAPWAAVQAVLAEPAIPGLTEGLADVTEPQWRNAIKSLRRDGLFNPDTGSGEVLQPDTLLDAHPLIREYFSRRFALSAPESFQLAHARLYDFYRYRGLPDEFQKPIAYAALAVRAAYPSQALPVLKSLAAGELEAESVEVLPPVLRSADSSEIRAAIELLERDHSETLKDFLPDDQEGMRPLFAAIAHGCSAGLHVGTFTEVYRPRIARGNAEYASKKLGLHGAELSALAQFFETPFSEVNPDFSPYRRGLLFNQVGFRLRAQGRLEEAEEPMRGGLDVYLDLGVPTQAAVNASNLSELLLTLGRLRDGPDGKSGAVSTAALAVEKAEEGDTDAERVATRSTHGEALMAAGAWEEANARFVQAEKRQGEWQTNLPLLYSLQGYGYCDLKLAQGRAAETLIRYQLLVRWRQQGDSVLDYATEELLSGRAKAQRVRDMQTDDGGAASLEALAQLDHAVEALKKAGQLQFLPIGHLSRAARHREMGSLDLATQDLHAAHDIAKRGGMRLFVCDAALESAQLRLARARQGDQEAHLQAAERDIAEAASIIEATGYLRRAPDLALAQAGLRLAKGETDAAMRDLQIFADLIQRHNLWSYLADFEKLARLHALEHMQPKIQQLKELRHQFDLQADEAFNAISPAGVPTLGPDNPLAEQLFERLENKPRQTVKTHAPPDERSEKQKKSWLRRWFSWRSDAS